MDVCASTKPKEPAQYEGQRFTKSWEIRGSVSHGEVLSRTQSCSWYFHFGEKPSLISNGYPAGWYIEQDYLECVKPIIRDICILDGYIRCTFDSKVEEASRRLEDFLKDRQLSPDFFGFSEFYTPEIVKKEKDFCNSSGRADPTFELFDIIELAASFGTITVFKKIAAKTGEEILEEVAEVSLRNWSKSALREGNYIVYRAFKDGKLYIGKTVDDMAYRYTREELDEITAIVIINGIPNNGTAKGVEQAIMELNGFIAGKANKATNPLSNIYNATVNEMYKKAGIEWLIKNKPNWKTDYLFR